MKRLNETRTGVREEKSVGKRIDQARESGFCWDICYCDPRNTRIASVWAIIRDYQGLHM